MAEMVIFPDWVILKIPGFPGSVSMFQIFQDAGTLTVNWPRIPCRHTHHEREEQRDGLDGLEEPHDGHAQDLDEREDVHLLDGHVTQEDVVRLVLSRAEHDQDALHELKAERETRNVMDCHTCFPSIISAFGCLVRGRMMAAKQGPLLASRPWFHVQGLALRSRPIQYWRQQNNNHGNVAS